MAGALIFDFDGTLVDTMPSIWAEYERVMVKLGLPEVSHREFTKQMGKPWNTILETLWPDRDPAEFNRVYWQDAEDIKPIEGAAQALTELKESHRLVIMSSRGPGSLRTYLKRAGIDERLFQAIYDREGIRHNKPDPRALEQVMKELSLDPEDTIFVGDGVVDAECAKEAGVRFVAVLSGGAYEEDFRDLGVSQVAGSVAELPSLLKEGR